MTLPDLNELFAGFTQLESLIFLAFCLVSFLFGLLVGYLLRSRKVRALRKELKKKEIEISQRDEKISQLTDEVALRDADYKKIHYQLEDANAQNIRWKTEQGKLSHQVKYLQEELEKERVRKASLSTTIDDLNDQLQNVESSGTLETDASEVNLSQQKPDLGLRLATVESKVKRLEAEKGKLEKTIADLKQPDGKSIQTLDSLTLTNTNTEEPSISVLTATNDILQLDRSQLQPHAKDDLNLIDGIGPFLEKKLNNAGIFTFEQISQWTADDIHKITQAIQFFEGRIEKDNWIGQAQELYRRKAGASQPEALSQPEKAADNLQLIEGINPEIEAILHAAGVHSFDQLAQTAPQKIVDLVEKADPKLMIYEHRSWPAQARLAANAEWEVLKDYQEQLRQGKY
ncbi:MAG: hypothetical protein HRU40_10260 [Saprospiraceae bacterium]|nr:hypothetical protein [Saprospiraceae bacterium]